MIFRRLVQHVKNQHWSAIGIELLIVILGVFIGFQVTDWANDRANRSAETRHLEEIAEDLRADAASFDGIQTSARMRIGAIDYILGETRGVSRPSRIVTPTGEAFDMPAGPPLAPADLTYLLSRANLVRSTTGNRTGFEALIGAGGMQTIRDRQISRQLQVYYAELDEMNEMVDILKQVRSGGVVLGYPLGLSAFGDMDPDKLIAIVRASPSYSAYLRTTREWAAIYLASSGQQRQRAVDLVGAIDKYLGKNGAPH